MFSYTLTMNKKNLEVYIISFLQMPPKSEISRYKQNRLCTGATQRQKEGTKNVTT